MDGATNALTYREFQPPPRLAGIVECFWLREPWQPPQHDLGVLPDGRVDLAWSADGELRVMGPQTRPLGRPFPPHVIVVGVRFAPAVGPVLLGLSGCELVDRHPSLEQLDSRPARALVRHLLEIDDAAQAPAVLTRALMRRLDSRLILDPIVIRATALLAKPAAQVGRVAAELAISERQLERRFRELIGYGPKTLHRVLRFQRMLNALTPRPAQPDTLARLAPALGYADQPHLTRETCMLSGLTPAQLERTVGALSAAGATGVFKTGSKAVRHRSSA